MTDIARRIASNLAGIKDRIEQAAQRSGRHPRDVTLVVVTKYVGVDVVRAIVDAGCLEIGESRPQELWHKAESLADLPIRWHMIGHLQRNKLRRTMPLVSLLHAGDSGRLLQAVDEFNGEQSTESSVLLEVNVSGDQSKHGFAPDALAGALAELEKLKHVRIRGLMAMAALEGGEEQARRDFARLRELRDRLQQSCGERLALDELSMGMSGDFEIAIEEGATIVRVGSALFEGIAV